MVGKAQKLHEVRSKSNSEFSLEKVDWWKPIATSTIQSRSCPTQFLGFFNHEKGAQSKKLQSNQQPAEHF
jgi:hypothetical protein